jgi:hypothetical protein
MLVHCGDDDDSEPKQSCASFINYCNRGRVDKMCVPPGTTADPLPINMCGDGTCGTVTDPCPPKQDASTDAGSPWADCDGARGAKLTCDSYGARHLVASHYDRSRRCFAPARPLGDLCGVPTFCPGGGGAGTCFVHEGQAYAAVFVYGEELTNPSWHHGETDTDPSTLTAAEQSLCDELWRTLRTADDDAGADAGSVLIDTMNAFEVAPACPD